jgi:hypothetical protein
MIILPYLYEFKKLNFEKSIDLLSGRSRELRKEFTRLSTFKGSNKNPF